MRALDIFKDTVLSEFKGLASDIGGEISAIGNYDTKDVKGLLDNVDKEKIKELVEKVKPLIPEYYEKARKMATDIFNQGKTEFDRIREEVENEVTHLFLVFRSPFRNVLKNIPMSFGSFFEHVQIFAETSKILIHEQTTTTTKTATEQRPQH